MTVARPASDFFKREGATYLRQDRPLCSRGNNSEDECVLAFVGSSASDRSLHVPCVFRNSATGRAGPDPNAVPARNADDNAAGTVSAAARGRTATRDGRQVAADQYH